MVACLSDGVTATLILKYVGQLQAGQSVFVPAAAGGLGFMAVQLAKLYGAGKVFGAASSPAKRQVVLDLGADAAIDYTVDGWAAQVKEANGGEQVDLALEMTGGPVFYETLEAVRPGGRSSTTATPATRTRRSTRACSCARTSPCQASWAGRTRSSRRRCAPRCFSS